MTATSASNTTSKVAAAAAAAAATALAAELDQPDAGLAGHRRGSVGLPFSFLWGQPSWPRSPRSPPLTTQKGEEEEGTAAAIAVGRGSQEAAVACPVRLVGRRRQRADRQTHHHCFATPAAAAAANHANKANANANANDAYDAAATPDSPSPAKREEKEEDVEEKGRSAKQPFSSSLLLRTAANGFTVTSLG